MPDRGERMHVVLVDPPHPSLLGMDELLAQCGLRAQRRSGPGGQHRNKTSSGVFLLHQPTGVTSEATERRSQADNRVVAAKRLRFRLAIELRTASIIDQTCQPDTGSLEAEMRRRYHHQSLRLNDDNEAKPAVLALVLNDLHAAGGQPSLVAPFWGATTSGIVMLTRSYPPAFALLNAIRQHHGRRPLK
jgi:hypothetical protein